MQVVVRHGARSPLDIYLSRKERGVWRCDSEDAISGRIEAVPMVYPRKVKTILDNRYADYPPNCRVGELTIEGMQQHYKLGQAYRKYLVDDLKFLNESLNPDEMFVRASNYDRTFKSALSFLKGLYEPQTIDEIIDITTGTSAWDVLRPKTDMCPDIANLTKEFEESEQFKNYLTEAEGVLRPLREYLNQTKWTKSSSNKMCDWLITMYCNEKIIDSKITSAAIDKCWELQGKVLFDLYGMKNETSGVGFSYGMREMFRILDNFLNGTSKVKFGFLSAHDSTLSVFLVALGHKLDKIPPLASHIAMEIYEKDNEKYVRFEFNGEPLELPLMNNQTLVKLNDFRTAIHPFIYNYCKEMP